MNAIVTRYDENIKDYTKFTLPTIEAYAKKLKVEIIVLNEEPLLLTADLQKHYRVLEIKKILESVDRVLMLDADILIRPDCPNLFDLIPEDKVGSVKENVGSRKDTRNNLIDVVQQLWGNVGWDYYTNAGVFMLSAQHKNIFDPHKGEYWCQFGNGDVHMGYNVAKYKHEVYELPFQLNHMTPWSDEWNGYANRFDSHIIHYAGEGVFDREHKNKVEQIKSDYESIF